MSRAPTLYGKEALPRSRSQSRLGPLIGGDLCLDVVNSIDRFHEQHASDQLAPGYANVIDWFEYAGVFDTQQSRRLLLLADRNSRDVAAIRRRIVDLREAIHSLVTGIIDERPRGTEALDVLNAEVTHLQAARHLVAGDKGLQWDWKTPLGLERPLWEIALAAERLLTSDRLNRLRQCDAPECGRVFIDTSRNGSRRYCTTNGCGAVERVRRFRDRQRPSD